MVKLHELNKEPNPTDIRILRNNARRMILIAQQLIEVGQPYSPRGERKTLVEKVTGQKRATAAVTPMDVATTYQNLSQLFPQLLPPLSDEHLLQAAQLSEIPSETPEALPESQHDFHVQFHYP